MPGRRKRGFLSSVLGFAVLHSALLVMTSARTDAGLVKTRTLTNSATATARSGPAEELLELVPAEAAIVLTAEDASKNAMTAADSAIVRAIGRLALVRTWGRSEGVLGLQRARSELETILGMPIPQFLSDVFGQAVVLSLHFEKSRDPKSARGLLLVRGRDRAVLDRLIKLSNDQLNPDLATVEQRQCSGQAYSVRIYRPGTKPSEAYVLFEDGVLAWSNSVALVETVIQRRVRGDHPRPPGLAEDARFQRMHARRPALTLLEIYGDPAVLLPLLTPQSNANANTNAENGKPEAIATVTAGNDAKTPGANAVTSSNPKTGSGTWDRLVEQYLFSLDALGLALEWRDGVVVHLWEEHHPDRLPPVWKRLVSRGGNVDALLDRVPNTALGVAVCHLDALALWELARELAENDVAGTIQWDDLMWLARGVFLDLDLVKEILPRLGPGFLVFWEAPRTNGDARAAWPFRSDAFTFLIGFEDNAKGDLARAVANAVRTVFAAVALNQPTSPKTQANPNPPAPQPTDGQGQDQGKDAAASRGGLRNRLHIETRDQVRLMILVTAQRPWIAAVGQGVVVLGGQEDSVVRSALAPIARTPRRENANINEITNNHPHPLAEFRARHFPKAQSFAAIDLPALVLMMKIQRPGLIQFLSKPDSPFAGDAETLSGDLDRMLELLGLFQGAFFATDTDADFRVVHRSLGLIGKTDAALAPSPALAPAPAPR